MKTKLKIDLLAFGNHTEAIVRMVCNHNAGIANVDFDIISGYVLAKKAHWPQIIDGKVALKLEYPNLSISDDEGETFYLVITECEMEELTPINNEAENIQHEQK